MTHIQGKACATSDAWRIVYVHEPDPRSIAGILCWANILPEYVCQKLLKSDTVTVAGREYCSLNHRIVCYMLIKNNIRLIQTLFNTRAVACTWSGSSHLQIESYSNRKLSYLWQNARRIVQYVMEWQTPNNLLKYAPPLCVPTSNSVQLVREAAACQQQFFTNSHYVKALTRSLNRNLLIANPTSNTILWSMFYRCHNEKKTYFKMVSCFHDARYHARKANDGPTQ